MKPGPLHDARVWRLVAGIGMLCAPQFAVLSFGTVFLHDFGGIGLGTLSVVMTSVQVGAMAMRVWSGRWTDQRKNRPAYLRTCSVLTVLLFGSLSAAAMGAHVASPMAHAVLIGLLLVSGVCVSAWHGVAYTELAMLSGAARAGTALGMANRVRREARARRGEAWQSGKSDDGTLAWTTELAADCRRTLVVSAVQDGAMGEVFRRVSATPAVPAGAVAPNC